ncbi:MAG: amidohydrolase family protein [Phaeodactylibacter sp.]|nr:amidohydrolase family protein [Phaeodactylibacter sp.]MCB9301383.1 amidohydrolase family protein [Lewinellaceae bacterium]
MRKFSADYIFPVASHPIRKGVVIVDDKGKILALDHREGHDPASLEIHPGIIVPGFVNTHCHLELSHMKGMAATGTGLLPFLKTVVNFRDISMEEIEAAIEKADQEMYEAGIVAVGDISNKLDTAVQKEKSPIHYYTFVEMFDFMQDTLAEQTFNQYKEVYDGYSNSHGNRKSCVPHAPYTVSPGLFQRINAVNEAGATISIHNQETAHEDEFFLTGTGGFMDFFRSFGFSMDHFQPSGKTAIHYALKHMDPNHRTLFVHNTMATPADIQAAQAWSDKVYWATCANANLYIENRLPHYNYFIDNNARMTIGTDSLTSNWQLSVLEEMKTIARFQSYIHFDTLLRWATLNGAEALGFEEELGSIEVGKKPGLNLLNLDEGFKLTHDTKVRRLV